MPDKTSLSEKWRVIASAIDVDRRAVRHKAGFWLYTAGATRDRLYFDIFNPSPQYGLPGHRTNEHGISDLTEDFGRLMCPLATNPMAFARFNLARSWIAACHKDHSSCQRRAKTPLLTRVIDVGPPDGSEEPRLYVSSGHSRSESYVVLTHCWGHSERLVTTKKNLNKHQRAIPINNLPATIRDAIKIVRQIGEKYLWVDQLCIVQDSRKDWEEEAVKMCDIYENSLFCLSALDCEDSSTGLLHEPEAEDVRFTMEHRHPTQFGVRVAPPTLAEAIAASPLSQRAWCLQERLLAPAILHFSQSQMFWECAECEASESQPSLRPSIGGAKSLLLNTPGQAGSTPRTKSNSRDTFAQWYEIVETYSGKSLTYQEDRLPAIVGLARKFSSLDKSLDHYLFGLWEEDIHRGLLWRTTDASASRSSRSRATSSRPSSRDSSVASSTTSSRRSSRAGPLSPRPSPRLRSIASPDHGDRPNGAPSWSWASITGKVT